MSNLGKQLSTIQNKKNANDVIYTPLPVAIKMMEMCDITPHMTVLDPCKGTGVFYDNLPECKKSFCEITEGRDFFDWTEKVDLIIGNPPYSIWTKWMAHTVKITDKFCYIMNNFNFTDNRMRDIINAGFGITQIHLLKIDWWFSHQYLVVFERNKPSIISFGLRRVLCDICGKRCDRGLNGNSANVCVPKKSKKPSASMV